jgi:very-short-patch-repair endonuclease
MIAQIDRLLARTGGVASRSRLLTVTTRAQLDREIRSGHLVSQFPRAYSRPWDWDVVLERAALVSVGPPAALSHTSALRRWRLPAGTSTAIHVTVPARRHPIGDEQLTIHRVTHFPRVLKVNGLITVSVADAVVGAWPLLVGPDQRAAALAATRTRLVSVCEVRSVADSATRLPGRRDLMRLLDLIEAGCESELELWGYLDVFDVPGLRQGVRQREVRAGGRSYRLDLAYEEERIAVELDGHAYHSTRDQRERDMRRDAALASIGWLTLRYSHSRLHTDVAGCRRDTLSALAARRQWRVSS